MAISLQIVELWAVGGFRPPPPGLTDFKKPGLNRVRVNRQQPRSAGLRPIQEILTPKKWLISSLPEVINQICKKHSLENSYDKKTSN